MHLSKSEGDDDYLFTATLFIPSGSGLVTIQFEQFDGGIEDYTNFVHLDFTKDNRVRLDDNDATKFGSFLRDGVFIVQVILKLNATVPTAHVAVGGAAASGEKDYYILPSFRLLTHPLGPVRLWVRFPWTGSFDATNIVVRDLNK